MEAAVLQVVKAARVRKSAGALTDGLIWVEVYLPFDVAAFAAFVAKVAEHGGDAVKAAAADPVLAAKALDPIDSQNEAMLPDDLMALAHGFLADSRQIDVRHSFEKVATVKVAQSFVNTGEIASPKFYDGAWVLALQLEPGSPEWAAVDKGELDAVSFATNVTKIRITVPKPAVGAAA